MAGTFVEFFSEEALENVMVMLKYKPERILYIGHKHNMITKKINSLKNFAARVSPETELVFIEVSRDDLDQIIQTLDDICEKYFSGMNAVQMAEVVVQALEAWFTGKEAAYVQQ